MLADKSFVGRYNNIIALWPIIICRKGVNCVGVAAFRGGAGHTSMTSTRARLSSQNRYNGSV